jgi:hypothetical protein
MALPFERVGWPVDEGVRAWLHAALAGQSQSEPENK